MTPHAAAAPLADTPYTLMRDDRFNGHWTLRTGSSHGLAALCSLTLVRVGMLASIAARYSSRSLPKLPVRELSTQHPGAAGLPEITPGVVHGPFPTTLLLLGLALFFLPTPGVFGGLDLQLAQHSR